jgi:integrase
VVDEAMSARSDFGDYRPGRKEPRDAMAASGAAANDTRTAVDHASLPVPLIARLYREAMKDKSYQDYELGRDVAAYLRQKRKVLTKDSYRDYESVLDKLVRYFCDLSLSDFEPPVGTERLEEFLEHQWGARAPRTYNKALSIISDFFKHHRLRDHLHGDPCLAIERARKRDVYRTTFTPDQTRAIIASAEHLRDRICLRLLLTYGLRKGALMAVQFEHFDHQRHRLTVFTKGKKIRQLPIPDPHFWLDLERHILDIGAQPSWYLLHRITIRPNRTPGASPFTVDYHDKPMGVHGAHKWWYRRLADAGIVTEGTSRGERMHKARHTAGQRVLDQTGNLKAVQKLLGHASIQTTGDVYADWDIDQLAASLKAVLEAEDEA